MRHYWSPFSYFGYQTGGNELYHMLRMKNTAKCTSSVILYFEEYTWTDLLTRDTVTPLILIAYAPSHLLALERRSRRHALFDFRTCLTVYISLPQLQAVLWLTFTQFLFFSRPPPPCPPELLQSIGCLLVLIRFPYNTRRRYKHSVVFLHLFTFNSDCIGYKYPSK